MSTSVKTKFGADTAEFDSAIVRMQGRLGGLKKGAQAAFGELGGFGKFFGIAGIITAAVAAVVRLANGAQEARDAAGEFKGNLDGATLGAAKVGDALDNISAAATIAGRNIVANIGGAFSAIAKMADDSPLAGFFNFFTQAGALTRAQAANTAQLEANQKKVQEAQKTINDLTEEDLRKREGAAGTAERLRAKLSDLNTLSREGNLTEDERTLLKAEQLKLVKEIEGLQEQAQKDVETKDKADQATLKEMAGTGDRPKTVKERRARKALEALEDGKRDRYEMFRDKLGVGQDVGVSLEKQAVPFTRSRAIEDTLAGAIDQRGVITTTNTEGMDLATSNGLLTEIRDLLKPAQKE